MVETRHALSLQCHEIHHSPLTIHVYENTEIHIKKRIPPDIPRSLYPEGHSNHAGNTIIDLTMGSRLRN